ncbi:MAG TPA: hypothetical protein VHI51_05390 [Ktedonobacterales bacterium]|nr:hypothetical protein [Ktedonobacterales bacterium]
MAEEDLIQLAREQRLMTLALADQVDGARWSEPALPGERSPHAMLSHLLGWDEWLIAVLEVSAAHELPAKLINAYRDIDGFNARSVERYAHVSRDDLLGGLQGTSARIVSSALSVGGPAWAERRIPELAPPREEQGKGKDGASAKPAAKPSRGPSVGGLLRMLRQHEHGHCVEFSKALGVLVDLEQLRADLTGEPRPASKAAEQPQQPQQPRS